MNILLIHNRYLFRGGEDTVLEQEETLLRSKGHQVEVLLFDNKDMVKGSKIAAFRKSFYNRESVRKVRDRIQQFRPDVIHLHNLIHVASPGVIRVARKMGVPTVMTIHNYRLLCPGATLTYEGRIYEKSVGAFFPWNAVKKGIYRGSRAQTFGLALNFFAHRLWGTWRKVDRYLVLTDFAKDLFLRGGFRESQLTVKPNMVNLPLPPARPRGKYALFAGRLEETKGIRVLLDAIPQAGQDTIIIGDGPLENLISDQSGINYKGRKPRKTVVTEMQKAAFLVFPSIWYEGMPMTILEAFALKTPVIASNLGAMKSMIRDGETGLLFEPGNAKDLAKKMKWARKHPEEMDRMAENAYREYQTNYTPEQNYQALMNIYESVQQPRNN